MTHGGLAEHDPLAVQVPVENPQQLRAVMSANILAA